MEWLQTYKIGKKLIDAGYEPFMAYVENYKPSYYKNESNEKIEFRSKIPYILDICVNLDDSSISFQYSDELGQAPHINYDVIIKDNVFKSISGRTTNYFLVETAPLQDLGKLFKNSIDKKFYSPKVSFIKDLIENELLSEEVLGSRFIETLTALSEHEVKNRLNTAIKSAKYLATDYFHSISSLQKRLNEETSKSKKKSYQTKIEKEKGKIEKFTSEHIYPANFNILLGENAPHEIAYTRLKIVNNRDSFYLNRENQYREICMAAYLFHAKIQKKLRSEIPCYFTGVKPTYPCTIPRDKNNVLRVSTDTNKNAQPYFKDERFLISKEAFLALKVGANYIDKDFKIKIANLNHYVIPDFRSDFELSKFRNELNKIELAFQQKGYLQTRKKLERVSANGLNSLSFIGYVAHPKECSIDIVNRISSVKPDRYEKLVLAINKAKENFEGYPSFSVLAENLTFATFYGIIPEKQRNIKNYTLELFKNLLEDHPIDKNMLLEHYSNLLQILNYSAPDSKNPRLFTNTANIAVEGKPENINEYRDWSISKATVKYLILLQTIDLLNNRKMNYINTSKDKPKTQSFFEECNFSFEKRALFYLGRILKIIATAQVKQKHAHKPILSRINYNGMSTDDVMILKNELLQKAYQYNKAQNAFNFAEPNLKLFEYYFSIAKKDSKWNLSDQDNVFYIFTGYALHFDLMEPKEKEEQEKALEIEEVNEITEN